MMEAGLTPLLNQYNAGTGMAPDGSVKSVRR